MCVCVCVCICVCVCVCVYTRTYTLYFCRHVLAELVVVIEVVQIIAMLVVVVDVVVVVVVAPELVFICRVRCAIHWPDVFLYNNDIYFNNILAVDWATHTHTHTHLHRKV